MTHKVLGISAFTASAFSAVLLLGSTAAQAGGCYGSSCRPAPCRGSACYNLVQTPPVYGTIAETQLVRKAQTHRRIVPAQYDYVTEKVMIQPARQIPHHVPAQYSSIQEKVLISPGGKRWEVTTDAHGRTTGCWVYDKPQYGFRQRTVEVSPARTEYETIPAVYTQRQRKVMVQPTQVLHETVPAVYETRHRKVLVSHGSQHWQKAGY
ncbi:hypothetical protein [Bosea sp. (in: a-proteobacteria)]|jgi:hypothetical protein|uniref:hypothetical protein n=1 Tax=Bosea sp. (in: a-proteobacteria) TaxID=1871050 RepID=UPI002732A0A9|nr:hypothetical protein [Bosea sp. (in: a-proteobacteria)]MDP3408929.1 hypothetical protein [Bosea sp. (in: a-proteobacteria)]